MGLPAKVDGAIVEEKWRSMVSDLIWSDGPEVGLRQAGGIAGSRRGTPRLEFVLLSA
jgi:hypothetical protein